MGAVGSLYIFSLSLCGCSPYSGGDDGSDTVLNKIHCYENDVCGFLGINLGSLIY